MVQRTCGTDEIEPAVAQIASNNNNKNNLPLIWLRQTAQPYIWYTTYNSLPRRAAMTWHTDCHAGQQ